MYYGRMGSRVLRAFSKLLVFILGEKMSEIQNIEENVPSIEIISHKGLNFLFYNISCDQLLIIFFRDYMDSVYVNYLNSFIRNKTSKVEILRQKSL